MNYEEMLAAAEDKQSYHLLDELPNEYNGKDTLATGRIKDNYIYVLVHDGQLNSLNNGEPISAEYFFGETVQAKKEKLTQYYPEGPDGLNAYDDIIRLDRVLFRHYGNSYSSEYNKNAG